MTAATKDVLTQRAGAEDVSIPNLRPFPVDAAKKIYAGTMVGVSASGYAGPASGTTYTIVVGVCEKQVDNTSGNAGDLEVLVSRGSYGHIAQTGTTIDKTKINSKVYAVDDSTVSLTSTSNALAGYVDFVDPNTSTVFYMVGLPALQ